MSGLPAHLAGPLMAIQMMDTANREGVYADLLQAGYSDEEARRVLLEGFVLVGVNLALQEEMAPEAIAAHLEGFAARLRSGEGATRAKETQDALNAWISAHATRPVTP